MSHFPVDQSGLTHGHRGVTKAGDPGLREGLDLAADYLRHIGPQRAARSHRVIVESGKHHDSALCHLGTTLATRLAACWRRRERYVLRDVDGTPITQAEGRAIAAERYRIPDTVPQTRRGASRAKQLKQRTARRSQESTKAAPAPGRAGCDASEAVA